ncbi:MAG: methyltransferase domain-containing protein [Candidatus Omnitrophica bacterium]|nr:methyltransferase domain-containing protein [Candidatus Omnitrophota bacterium]
MKQDIDVEKRFSPRIGTNFPIQIEGATGNIISMSDTGACFCLEQRLPLRRFTANIHLPSRALEIIIHLKWKQYQQSKKDSFLYGAQFIDLDEKTLSAIRKSLIFRQLRSLIKDIHEKEIRSKVVIFAKAFKQYLYNLIRLTNDLENNQISKEEAKKYITYLNNEIILKGDRLEKELNQKKIIRKIKQDFRFLVSCWAYRSSIMKRAYEKPRGYPGDYRMLEAIYDNKPFSKKIGEYFDLYFLNNPYAIAVRNRKDKLGDMLKNFIETANLDSIKILNLACGSCREIAELLPSLQYRKPIYFTCIDWDQEALDFSKNALKNSPPNVTFNFLKKDLIELIKNGRSPLLLKSQDLIYSIGLVDYLPDRMFKKIVQASFRLLAEEGVLIITHKNKEQTFSPIPPDWFCDWKFVPRNMNEVVDLFKNSKIDISSLNIEVDNFNHIYYFILTKK